MKKAFTAFTIATVVLYVLILYFMLFRMPGRQMVITSEHMLENYNYWNSINLVPFKTINQYITVAIDGSIRGHAIRNLIGNLLLFFPAGFYLPFFAQKMGKLKIYSITMAVLIIVVEIVQVLSMMGSLDVDDFILNFMGALLGYFVFSRTPARSLFKLRAWQKSDIRDCHPISKIQAARRADLMNEKQLLRDQSIKPTYEIIAEGLGAANSVGHVQQ